MNERIWIVEDEEALRMTLTDRLMSEGYKVDSSPSGQDGLLKATQQAYDLVLLDVMLPRKSGLDVCRDIRAGGNDCAHLDAHGKGAKCGQDRRLEDRGR